MRTERLGPSDGLGSVWIFMSSFWLPVSKSSSVLCPNQLQMNCVGQLISSDQTVQMMVSCVFVREDYMDDDPKAY